VRDETTERSFPNGALYLVVSGAPAPEGVPALVRRCQDAGWRIVVFSTPAGTRFIDLGELEQLTGEPVRSEYRLPGTGKAAPTADALLACPLTFKASTSSRTATPTTLRRPALRDGWIQRAGCRRAALQTSVGETSGVRGESGDARPHGHRCPVQSRCPVRAEAAVLERGYRRAPSRCTDPVTVMDLETPKQRMGGHRRWSSIGLAQMALKP
jgi:hypothetical protein